MEGEIFNDIERLENKLLSKEALPHLVIFLGSENHLYEKLINSYYQAIRKSYPSSELISINGLDSTPTEFHAELFTIPLFVSARLVVLKHSDAFFKNIEAEPTVLKHFDQSFKRRPETAFLFMQLDSLKLPKKFAHLQKTGVTFQPDVPKGRQMFQYFKAKAKQFHCEIGEPSIELLLSKCSWDYHQAQRSFDQFILTHFRQGGQTNENKMITNKMVSEFCEEWKGDRYFEIIDQIAEKKIGSCIKNLNQHKFNNGMEILNGLIRLFSDSYRYYYFKKMNLPHSEILERLNMTSAHPFMIQKSQERFQKLMHYYPESSIYRIFTRLNQLDEQLKTEPKEKHLTLLIMFLASLENA